MSSRIDRVLRAGQARSVATGTYDQASLVRYVERSAAQRAELEALKRDHAELQEQLRGYQASQDCQMGLKERLAKERDELRRQSAVYQRMTDWYNQVSHTLSSEDGQAAQAAQVALRMNLEKISADINALRRLIAT